MNLIPEEKLNSSEVNWDAANLLRITVALRPLVFGEVIQDKDTLVAVADAVRKAMEEGADGEVFTGRVSV